MKRQHIIAIGATAIVATVVIAIVMLRPALRSPAAPPIVQADENISNADSALLNFRPDTNTAQDTQAAKSMSEARSNTIRDDEDLPEASAQEAKDYMIAHHMATARELNAYNEAEMDAALANTVRNDQQ